MKGLKFLYSIHCLLTFIAVMLLIFPFVIVASFFGRIRGGNLVFRLCMFWGDCWFPLIFIRNRKIYEAPHDRKQPFIFVTNHISYLDSAILVKAYRQPIRALGKMEMTKIPVFGFIYRNAIVTVDRRSPANRAKSVLILKSVISRGISVLVFPEGTFNLTDQPLKEFYDGAFRIAIETQTPVKPVLFLDSYRRMPYESIFRMTPGRSRILYLAPVPVDGYTSGDVGALRDRVFEIMKSKLIEYDGAWAKTTGKADD